MPAMVEVARRNVFHVATDDRLGWEAHHPGPVLLVVVLEAETDSVVGDRDAVSGEQGGVAARAGARGQPAFRGD